MYFFNFGLDSVNELLISSVKSVLDNVIELNLPAIYALIYNDLHKVIQKKQIFNAKFVSAQVRLEFKFIQISGLLF